MKIVFTVPALSQISSFYLVPNYYHEVEVFSNARDGSELALKVQFNSFTELLQMTNNTPRMIAGPYSVISYILLLIYKVKCLLGTVAVKRISEENRLYLLLLKNLSVYSNFLINHFTTVPHGTLFRYLGTPYS